MDNYQGPAVTISGRIIFPGYQEGQWVVVSAATLPVKAREPSIIADTLLSGPGRYFLQVPQNSGAIQISAQGIERKDKVLVPIVRGRMAHPLEVGQDDIKGADVVLGPDVASTLMDTYQGPTVTVSGRIIFPGYRQGQLIHIVVAPLPSGDVALASPLVTLYLEEPGEYSLSLPRNAGNVKFRASVFEAGMYGSVAKGGLAEPLKVGDRDLDGVDITILPKGGQSLLMRSYQGPTVRVSGRVIYPGYREGQQVRIVARSFPEEAPADIEILDLSRPGEFSLQVPRYMGELYLGAVVLQPGETRPGPDNLRKLYNQGRPVKVNASDIQGVDIMLVEE
jgi:hypothetical protein